MRGDGMHSARTFRPVRSGRQEAIVNRCEEREKNLDRIPEKKYQFTPLSESLDRPL